MTHRLPGVGGGTGDGLATPAAIIFDLDNTVVHSQIDFAGIRRTLAEMLAQAGVALETAALDGPRRRSIGEIIDLGLEHDVEHGTRLGPAMWQMVAEYERQGMVLASVEADAGPTLTELRRRGHPLGILTNNARVSALEALRKFQLLAYFDPVLAREDVPAMKPSPTGLEAARVRLCARATRLLMVGDSWLDGLAARNAGCPFVAFRARSEELAHRGLEPVAVINNLSELLELEL